MKKVYATCASLLVLLNAAQAASPIGLEFHAAGVEWPSSLYDQDAKDRALQLTCYFTDMLHLTQKQAAEVRRLTYQQLQEQEQAATEQAPANSAAPAGQRVQQYEAAMARVLTPDQYSAFRLLEERPLVVQLLGGSAR